METDSRCGFRDPDFSDDRQILIEQALHFNNELWEQLVTPIKQKLDGIAQIEVEPDLVSISLPDIKDFGIYFELFSFDGDDYNDEFDTDDLDGMLSEEAIDFLSDYEELPLFDYVTVCASRGVNSTVWVIEDDNFSDLLNAIAEGLQKTPEVYKTAIEEASIELQKKADEQRTIQERINIRKEAEARDLAELEDMVKPKLIEFEWHRPFRVSMNFGYYVLSLKLPVDVECRYESPNKADIISRVG
ncbi:MAG: hypothetical protein HDS09_03330 [Bacteroides sp.]|nr:hypothetical protein [Bacteroides sp.]